MASALLLLPVLLAAAAAACPECSVHDRTQAARLKLEAIKRQILSKLHMAERPNITSPLAREEALEALRRTQGGRPPEGTPGEDGDPAAAAAARDEYFARPSEIIAFAEPGQSLNGHYLLDFYPHEYLNSHLRVTAATLWIQLRYAAQLSAEGRAALRSQHVTLYAFLVGNSTEQLSHVTSYHQGAAHPGWRRLDVGAVVRQWLAGGRDKLTLLVDCAGCNAKLEMVLFNEDGGRPPDLRPFLSIATETAAARRSRRHSRRCGEASTHCCRQNLYVSFKELGWSDWIIAPKGYHANFCMGNCEAGGRRGYSYHNFHTHIIEEYRNRNPYASIQPCCAPTRLSSMSLIYFDTDLNIIKTDLPKMSVEECGCT